MQMRQLLRAPMSASNSVTRGQCLHSLGEAAKRPIREAELIEMPHGILEIIAARAAAAGSIEDYTRRLVERQLAGVIRAAPERSKRKSLPCHVCRLHPQKAPLIDQPATHLSMPYPIERVCRRSKHGTTARPAAIEPEGQSGISRRSSVIVGIEAEAAVIATQQ